MDKKGLLDKKHTSCTWKEETMSTDKRYEELKRWVQDTVISEALIKVYDGWEKTDNKLRIPAAFGDYGRADFCSNSKDKATWLLERDSRDKTAETFMRLYGADEGTYCYRTMLLGYDIEHGVVEAETEHVLTAEEAEDLFDSLSANYVFGDLESAFNVYGWIFRTNAADMKRYTLAGIKMLRAVGKREGILPD